MADADDFDAWMKKAASTGRRGGPNPSWDSWPDAMKKEINKALAYNDNGGRRVTAASLLQRFRKVYDVRMVHSTLHRYCVEKLNRRGWSRPGDPGE